MAKKTVPPKKRRAAAKAPAQPRLVVTVDYPQEGEQILPGHYSIRVTAAGAAQAQVRFGDGEWLDCRESVGHFWFDWNAVSGEFALGARARVDKGRWASSAARSVRVS